MYSLMKVFTPKIFLSLISLGTSMYDSGCPHVSQAKFRCQAKCNGTSQYTCLLDTNEQSYKELCTEVKDIQTEGHKSVFRGSVDGISCDHSRFQPFPYNTNIGPACVFIKSSCSGEGQIISSEGSSIVDVSCKCDYRDGYSYIQLPKNKCSCNPNQEDCSCYLIHCNSDEIHTQDYQCMRLYELTGKFRCKSIEDTETDLQKEIVKNSKLAECSSEYQDRLYSSNSTIVIFVLIFVVGIFIGIKIMVSIMRSSYSPRIFNDDGIKLDSNIPIDEEYRIRKNRYASGSRYFEEDESPESFRRNLHTSAINEVKHSRIKYVLPSVKVCKVNDDGIKLDIDSPTREECRIRRKRYVSCSSYFEHDESLKTFLGQLYSAKNEVGHSRIKFVLPSVKVCKVNDDGIKLDANSPKREEYRIRRNRYVSCSSHFEHNESPESFLGHLYSAINEVGHSRIKCVLPSVKVCKVNDGGIKLDINCPKSRIRRKRYVSCSSYFEQDEPPESFRRRLHS